jgi:DNA helicase IV
MGESTPYRGAPIDAQVAAEDDTSDAADRNSEQRYLDWAHNCLSAMSARTGLAAADAEARSAGDWDATVAHMHLSRRLSSLNADGGPLCFGRTDEDNGPSWYIGRRHVEDSAGDPVVVDWRAPVAIPFYRATFRDPLGLERRRRFILDGRELVDLLDEDFDDPASAEHATGAGLPDPLLAELGRARTGAMRDIVATIAAEQDMVIRAPLDTPIVVQGGPGTGKTAVGLHRAAFLLYEYRGQLERQGVLVLGPNRIFLEYISEVLPSLGEVAVVQTTLPGLVGQWQVRGSEPAGVAELKGDGRMAEVIARACLQVLGLQGLASPSSDLVANTRWGRVTLSATQTGELFEAALESGGPIGQRRARFRRAMARRVAQGLADRRPDIVVDLEAVEADIRSDRALQRSLDRLWPSQSPPSVIRSLLGRPATLAAAASGLFSDGEQGLLRRQPARSVAAEPWTAADLPLLDEADAQLNGPSRRYGHIVVDEAQDLSPMGLRMMARRSLDGRSVTVLGDLAQATAPGCLREWDTVFEALGRADEAEAEAGLVRELTIGYRVPRRIMDLANGLLASMAPGLPQTESVRSAGDEPVVVSAEPSILMDAVANEAARLLDGFLSVGVITASRVDDLSEALTGRELIVAPPGRAHDVPHVSVLAPEEAKGLEFDAVIVVEPAAFLALGSGTGLLYIALTRAVQHLSLVHSVPLPAVLRVGGR